MDIILSMDLPSEVEQQLDPQRTRLALVAQEAIALDLFRKGLLSHAQLGQALKLDRFETDALLKQHGVGEQALSHEEVDTELESINELIGPPRQ